MSDGEREKERDRAREREREREREGEREREREGEREREKERDRCLPSLVFEAATVDLCVRAYEECVRLTLQMMIFSFFILPPM